MLPYIFAFFSLVVLIALVAFAAIVKSAVRDIRRGFDEASTAEARTYGSLEAEFRRMRAAFAPTQTITCKHCGGRGEIERDNPLVSAISEAIEHGTHKRK